jgi:hypothetical protein
MRKYTRDVVSRKLQALPGRRFSRYPKLEPDLDLGPLDALPGKWVSGDTGWNMIALPFASPAGPPFRLLLNQYKETLRFSFVDEKVPNRGITSAPRQEKDQLVVTLDYEQSIEQVSAVDEPVSGKAGGANLAIHHEPGLFLYLTNQVDDDIDIGRLASIPHGNSVLALGTSDGQGDRSQGLRGRCEAAHWQHQWVTHWRWAGREARGQSLARAVQKVQQAVRNTLQRQRHRPQFRGLRSGESSPVIAVDATVFEHQTDHHSRSR